jgi:uncharacterized protein (TIGR02996 family)
VIPTIATQADAALACPLLRAVLADPNDHTARLAYADYLRESGDELLAAVVSAQVTHSLPFATTPVREVEIDKLASDYDWQEVFGVGSGGNCTPKADACPPGASVDMTPPVIGEVAEVIAAVNGEPDEEDWLGLFRMNDGRFVVAYAGCDYTGWD